MSDFYLNNIDDSKSYFENWKNEDIYLTGWLRRYFSKVRSKFEIGELDNSLRRKEFFIKENFQE